MTISQLNRYLRIFTKWTLDKEERWCLNLLTSERVLDRDSNLAVHDMLKETSILGADLALDTRHTTCLQRRWTTGQRMITSISRWWTRVIILDISSERLKTVTPMRTRVSTLILTLTIMHGQKMFTKKSQERDQCLLNQCRLQTVQVKHMLRLRWLDQDLHSWVKQEFNLILNFKKMIKFLNQSKNTTLMNSWNEKLVFTILNKIGQLNKFKIV